MNIRGKTVCILWPQNLCFFCFLFLFVSFLFFFFLFFPVFIYLFIHLLLLFLCVCADFWLGKCPSALDSCRRQNHCWSRNLACLHTGEKEHLGPCGEPPVYRSEAFRRPIYLNPCRLLAQRRRRRRRIILRFYLTRTITIPHSGGGGSFLVCEDFGRMCDNSFPACVFFFF